MNNLQEKLQAHKKVAGIALEAISTELNISGAALCDGLNGKDNGVNEKMTELVQQYLERDQRRAQEISLIKKDFDFVETTIYKRISEGVEMADLRGEIRVVIGESGVGKTRALKHIEEFRMGSIYVAVYAGIRKSRFLSKLCDAAKIEAKGSCDDKFESLVRGLRGSGRLIMIDEVEHLSIEALDTLRSINDCTGCGLILAGLPIFYNRLRTRQADYAYIYNRTSIPVITDLLKESDVAKLVTTILPDCCNVPVQVWFNACGGIGRDLRMIVQESIRVAEVNSIQIGDTPRFTDMILAVRKALGRQFTK
ncbi:MAG: AAA family ATPase [Bacteroidales bacterium]